MKVGFIVECGPDGADVKVLSHLVGKLRNDLTLRFTTMGTRGKREILEDCDKLVMNLFEAEGCDWVFVVWDLMPCNPEHHQDGKPSCKKERKHIWDKLRHQDQPRTRLCCITHELEAWLLADGAALTKVLKRDTKPMRPIADERTPEQIPNPKGRIKQHFKQHRPGQEYNDLVHALKIIEHAQIPKLERAPSFVHFRKKVEGLIAPPARRAKPNRSQR